MKSFSKRRLIFTLALAGLALTGISCKESDERTADLKVQEAIKSSAKNRLTPTTQAWNSVVSDLNTAVGASGASLPEKIRAGSLLGEAEFESGDRFVRQLNQVEPVIASTLWEIGQLAGRIESVNNSVKGLMASEPAPTLAAIAAKNTEMTAAGAAAVAKAGEFQGKIDQIKGQVATLTQQKDAAIAEADAAEEKASKAAAKDALPLLDASTEGRRKAGNIGHDIDKVSAGLFALEHDLAAEQAKKKSADDAVATLDEAKKATDAGWAAVQTQIQAEKAKGAALGEALAAKANELESLNKQAAGLRDKALEQFDKSAKQNHTASIEATDLAKQLGSWTNSDKFKDAPEAKAWVQMGKTYNLNIFKLYEAQAVNAAANLYGAQALQLAAQQKIAAGIAKALAEAGVTMPAALSAPTVSEQKTAVDKAAKAYADAIANFKNVFELNTIPEKVRETAKIANLFALCSEFLIGDGTKLQTVKDFAKDDPALRAVLPDLHE